MIWFLREGSITSLISSDATRLQQSQVPLAGVLAQQHFQDKGVLLCQRGQEIAFLKCMVRTSGNEDLSFLNSSASNLHRPQYSWWDVVLYSAHFYNVIIVTALWTSCACYTDKILLIKYSRDWTENGALVSLWYLCEVSFKWLLRGAASIIFSVIHLKLV